MAASFRARGFLLGTSQVCKLPRLKSYRSILKGLVSFVCAQCCTAASRHRGFLLGTSQVCCASAQMSCLFVL